MFKIFVLAQDTFRILRRENFFIPMILSFFAVGLFAAVASAWGVWEFDKIFFDISFFWFHIAGSLMAIFVAIHLIQNALVQGEADLFISGPVSRGEWILGKYLGLWGAFIALSFLLWFFWLGLSLFFSFPILFRHFYLFGLGWCVIGSFSFFFGMICSYGIAFFASFSLFFVGTSLSHLQAIMPKDLDWWTKSFINFGAQFFDLQKFYPVDYLSAPSLGLVSLYGLGLGLFFLSLSILVFQKKDL
jgi:ABC-type transport system involved in multi-copper enzyme maturation permease subunit